MDKKATCTFAFTLGAATGAAMGLLFAPQPGSESRRQVKKWMDSTGSTLKDCNRTTAEKIKGGIRWMKGTTAAVGEKAHALTEFIAKRRQHKPAETVQMVECTDESLPATSFSAASDGDDVSE